MVDTILLLFYMAPLQTLANTIAKGSTFSISSPFDITKLQKNCLDVSSTGSFPFSISMDTHIYSPYHPYGDGDSTWTYTTSRESLFNSVFPKIMISTVLSVNIFTCHHSFMDA
jgi:hypothetical protein